MNETPLSASTMDLSIDPALPGRASPRSLTKPLNRAESQQRKGKAMVVAGWVVTLLGVVLYCAATFSAGVDADMGALLTENVVPFAHATLAVMGLGTLLWLTGSFVYLKGAMDA